MLPRPAHYFPFSGGRYEVKAGLHKFGTDFGNGAADTRVFQLDSAWPAYRVAKMAARAERLSKYVLEQALAPRVREVLTLGMLEQLLKEHPQHFRDQPTDAGVAVGCALSGETLLFDRALGLIGVEADRMPDPQYTSALDALVCQVQEDLAVVEIGANGIDRLTALHLCCPNHWAAEDKIGRGFVQVHAPVPGMDRINRAATALMRSLARRGRAVRFAWGLATDDRLNHHPFAPPEADAHVWRGRRFDPRRPRLYTRIERQTLIAMPTVDAFAFTIRTYFEDVAALTAARRAQLAAAIESMDELSRQYKGLAGQEADILAWLRAAPASAQ